MARDSAASEMGKRVGSNIGLLEIGLAGATLSLLFQIIPTTWSSVFGWLDFRQWARGTWIASTLVVLAVLFVWRCMELFATYVSKRLILPCVGCIFIISSQVVFFLSVPNAWSRILDVINPRNWSQLFWIGVFTVILTTVFIYRYFPEWRSSWAARSKEITKKKEKERKIQRLREEKQRVEDIIIHGRRIDF